MMKFKKIGFAGAHRTGKSTMAQELAQQWGYEYCDMNVRNAQVWEKCSISPSDQMTFAERLKLQQHLLEHIQQVYETAPENAVYDRTPVDLIGYLLANIDGTCSDLFSNDVEKFIGNCMRLSILNNDRIILIQPAIKPEKTNKKIGKTFLSRPYQIAVNNHILAMGIQYLPKNRFIIMPQHIVSVPDRIEFINQELSK